MSEPEANCAIPQLVTQSGEEVDMEKRAEKDEAMESGEASLEEEDGGGEVDVGKVDRPGRRF